MVGEIGPSAHYVVHERIAAGGMGEVYLGTVAGHAGRRRIAIKQLSPARLSDPAAVDRLVNEARVGYRLTHGNVCQVFDLVLDERGVFLVLEYVDGMDLRNLCKKLRDQDRDLDPAIVLYVAREAARGLDFAHRLKDEDGRPIHVVHGDVTPPNLLISDSGEVKVADFGIARALGMAAPGQEVVGGTRGFMAPEAAAGTIDPRIDVYALGATMHYALVGKPPARPGDVSLLSSRSDVSRTCVDLIKRAIHLDMDKRFSSCSELDAALSFELARRYPTFLPANLGNLVARLRAGKQPALRPLEERTLFSIALPRVSLVSGDSLPYEPTVRAQAIFAKPPSGADTLNRRGETSVEGTQTVLPVPVARRSRFPWPVAVAVVGLAAAIVATVVVASIGSPGEARSAHDTAAATDGGSPGSQAAAAAPISSTDASSDASSSGARAAASTMDASVASSDSGAVALADAGPAPERSAELSRRERRPRRERRKQLERERKQLERAPAPPDSKNKQPAYLSVNASPWGAVEVDGAIIARETPAFQIELRPGRHRVRVVFGDGTKSRTRVVNLAPGQSKSLGFRKD